MSRVTTLFGMVALSAATAVMAQVPQEPPEPGQPGQQQRMQAEETFTGEIVTVNADAKTLTVREKEEAGVAARPTTPTEPGERPTEPGQRQPGAQAMGETKTFHLDTQTEITSRMATGQQPGAQPGQQRPGEQRPGMTGQQETIELKDLKEGDTVTVKYEEEGGKNMAKSVELTSRRRPTS